MFSRPKLAILTDEVSQDLDSVIRFAQELKLDGIELRSLFGRAFKDLTREDIAFVRERSLGVGLQIAGCASPVFKCDLDSPSDIAAHVDLFRRSVETAIALECDIVRVFTFLRRSNPATSDDLRRAAEHFHALLDVVRGTNVRVGVENEASCIVATGPEVREFLSHLPVDPQLGVVWDPCNVLYVDGGNDPVRDDFPLVRDRVMHVHFKDASRDGSRAAQTCVELGKGQVDFAAQITELRAMKYTGWITLETHWRTEALDPETQHLPAGYAFSANAEPASRICMTALQRWLAA
ncbi:sugar phosphate isomerase/epimerase family protein [Verrucomicrobiota bacterium sgz303538]